MSVSFCCKKQLLIYRISLNLEFLYSNHNTLWHNDFAKQLLVRKSNEGTLVSNPCISGYFVQDKYLSKVALVSILVIPWESLEGSFRILNLKNLSSFIQDPVSNPNNSCQQNFPRRNRILFRICSSSCSDIF